MTEDAGVQVVLHYRSGRTERCSLTGEFSPGEAQFEVADPDGALRQVDVDELKAVFFLKSRRRRDAEMQMGAAEKPSGAPARVEFFDGEVITGLVQHYSIANRGFFLYPTTPESNNEMVFVVASALTGVDIEG